MLRCPKCNSGNIIPDRFSETGKNCLMCGTQKGFINKEAYKEEDNMPKQLTLDLNAQPLMPEEKAVWDCVKDCAGKGNEILGTVIATRTGIGYTTVRAIIAHLINHKYKLIGSNSKGYYVPVAPEEIDEVTKSLRHRGIMVLVRAANLQKTSLTEIFKQSCLEFEQEVKKNDAA